MQLKKTMDQMLDKAGVYDTDAEIKGPTQVGTTDLTHSLQQKAAFNLY